MKNKKLKLTLANMAAITLIATQGTAVFANYSSSNVNTASNVPGANTDDPEKYPEDIIEETKPKLESEKAKLAEIKQKKAEVEKNLKNHYVKLTKQKGKKLMHVMNIQNIQMLLKQLKINKKKLKRL